MDVDSSTRISNSQLAASKAEREAADKITAARKRVSEVEREASAEVDRAQVVNGKRLEAEMIRTQDRIESQRNEGYSQVRDIKRSQEAEIQKTRRDSEKTLDQTQAHYQHAQSETESRGERALKELEMKNFAQQEFQRKQGEHQVKSLKTEQEQVQSQLHAQRVATHEELGRQSTTERKNLEQKTRESIQTSKDHYSELYGKTVQDHGKTMADLSHATNEEIKNIRRDSSHKLDAYSSRQADPFYKLVGIGANLDESDSHFILTANIPEHEQGRVGITVRGNEIVVSGQRRNQEALTLEDGRKQSTSSFQSYNESFPLTWPVNAKLMTKEFRGDQMIVTIPKQTYPEPLKQPRTAQRALAERPQYPKNLPGEKQLAELANRDREEGEAAKVAANSELKTKGYKPLA